MKKQWYTRAELVAEAHAAGYKEVEGRLVAWWVTLGLLDESVRGPSRGRAGGVPRYWSHHQRDLFLLLLKNQEGGVKRTPTLCNIPVGWWLYRGDPYVPLRQAKRVLGTWFDKTAHASWERSTYSARELMDAFLPPLRADLHDEVLSAIANITYAGRFDSESLRLRLRELAGPENEIVREGQTFYLTDLAVGRIEAVLHAREHFEEIPDAVYRFARTELQKSAAAYVRDQPRLAAMPDIGHLATPLVPEDQIEKSCPHLAQLLGHLLIAADKATHPTEP